MTRYLWLAFFLATTVLFGAYGFSGYFERSASFAAQYVSIITGMLALTTIIYHFIFSEK